jgi:hypothetical protein
MKRKWADHPLVRRVENSLVGRIIVAAIEIRLYDRALTIAGQAFIALVPLLIVVAFQQLRLDGDRRLVDRQVRAHGPIC